MHANSSAINVGILLPWLMASRPLTSLQSSRLYYIPQPPAPKCVQKNHTPYPNITLYPYLKLTNKAPLRPRVENAIHDIIKLIKFYRRQRRSTIPNIQAHKRSSATGSRGGDLPQRLNDTPPRDTHDIEYPLKHKAPPLVSSMHKRSSAASGGGDPLGMHVATLVECSPPLCEGRDQFDDCLEASLLKWFGKQRYLTTQL